MTSPDQWKDPIAADGSSTTQSPASVVEGRPAPRLPRIPPQPIVSDLSHIYLEDGVSQQETRQSASKDYGHPQRLSIARNQQSSTVPQSYQPHQHYHHAPAPARPIRTTSLPQPQNVSRRYQNPPSLVNANEERWQSSPDSYRGEYDEKYGPSFPPNFQDPLMPAEERDLEAFSGPNGRGSHVAYPFPQNRPGGPAVSLVSHIKNDWQKNIAPPHKARHRRASSSSYGSESDFGLGQELADFLRSRACQRYVCIYLIVMVIFVLGWVNWLGPSWGDQSMLTDSLKSRMGATRGFFGHNLVPSFQGMTQTQELERWKVPGSGESLDGQPSSDSRRLIIVGDIHGCLDELNDLLKTTGFDPVTDHLVTTGDMISRGPSSPEVLSLLVSYNASCVRGNHEDRVLLARRDLMAPSHRKTLVSQADGKNGPTVSEIQPLKQGAASDLELASTLSEAHIKYLQACPLILDMGRIADMGQVAVVHAGLVPMVPFDEQDPASVMNMRSIDLRSHVPSREPPPPANAHSITDKAMRDKYDKYGRATVVKWPKLWNAYQGLLKKTQRTTVIYGHNAKEGLQKEDWSWGLDGNCVRGGQLAALVLSGRSNGDVGKKVVTVKCKDYTPRTATLEELGGS